MSLLLEGEARGYSNVKEVGCRKTTSKPRKRLPRATCGEERRRRAVLGADTPDAAALPLYNLYESHRSYGPLRSKVPTYTGESAQP